jgi:hypothetical protein
MARLDELAALLGEPSHRQPSPDDWVEVENFVGSSLPRDFKAFMDAYGTGQIAQELVVFHPRGSSPLLKRMREIHETFGESRERWREDFADDYPYPFHPAPGGLISWGYDHGGDEHFFLPCDPDPDRWKIVTMVHEIGCETFDGPFTDFVLAFIERLRFMDENGVIGPAVPSFEPF